MAAGASVLAPGARSQRPLEALDPTSYPPGLTGLRGNHPGSESPAHGRAWAIKSEWGPTADLEEEYDLIVVGGGISGLSAAFF